MGVSHTCIKLKACSAGGDDRDTIITAKDISQLISCDTDATRSARVPKDCSVVQTHCVQELGGNEDVRC